MTQKGQENFTKDLFQKNERKKSMELQNENETFNTLEIKDTLEPKTEFYKKVENYYNLISNNNIPINLMQEIINQISDRVYSDYSRFWKQYPKSRKRYSQLKLEDLKHPFIHYRIIDFLKLKDYDNYEKYSLILLKMNKKEFEELEIYKHQYETK